MSRAKHPNSRWIKGSIRVSSKDAVAGSWNVNLQTRERAPLERAYLDSFTEQGSFKHGARVRARK